MINALAAEAYFAYGETTDHKNYQGLPMPKWEELPAKIQAAWVAATARTAASVARPDIRKQPVGLNFGEALGLMRNGLRVAREGWNGKGMWIALTPGSEILPTEARNGAAKIVAGLLEENAPEGFAKIRIGAHIDMKAADGTLVIGWLASQTDMLAEDWEVVR